MLNLLVDTSVGTFSAMHGILPRYSGYQCTTGYSILSLSPKGGHQDGSSSFGHERTSIHNSLEELTFTNHVGCIMCLAERIALGSYDINWFETSIHCQNSNTSLFQPGQLPFEVA
ncbi:hypothetical protein Tco_1091851 [Tanacetum coccineum]|uniref:Uncharacterized protein n=1 Tax=Tanacetum coccineum TaxID=301880 RepID=A0ABQ5I888_9ASTR